MPRRSYQASMKCPAFCESGLEFGSEDNVSLCSLSTEHLVPDGECRGSLFVHAVTFFVNGKKLLKLRQWVQCEQCSPLHSHVSLSGCFMEAVFNSNTCINSEGDNIKCCTWITLESMLSTCDVHMLHLYHSE